MSSVRGNAVPRKRGRASTQERRCPIAILQIIDQLADKLNNSPKMPLTNNRIVDAAEIGQLLERLRISVPSSIMESERTLAERERILAEAEAEAKRTIERAKQRAAELLNQDSLVNMARREAERMAEDARALSSQRIEEADAYASQVLEDLNNRLAALGRQVENGLQVMKGRRTDTARARSARPGEAPEQQQAGGQQQGVSPQQAQYAPRASEQTPAQPERVRAEAKG